MVQWLRLHTSNAGGWDSISGQGIRPHGSVQFSHSVMSESFWPHGLQHTRLPCPSPTPRAYSTMSVESVMPSSHLILYCPLLLLPPIPPSIRVFSSESTLHIRWPKYWSFSFNISPSNEHSGLISFRMDWFDFLAVQGTLKSLLQHHSSKASILWCSAFFTVQLSHPYMTTGKIMAFTRWSFVGKVMSLLFNMLSRLVIAFLPWSKHLLISTSAVILELPKIKSLTVSIISPSICHEVMGPNAVNLWWIRDQITTSHWIIKKAREFQKQSTSALLTTPKPLTVWIATNYGKFWKRWEIADHSTCLLRNLYAGQAVDMEQQTSSKLGKEYVKAV